MNWLYLIVIIPLFLMAAAFFNSGTHYERRNILMQKPDQDKANRNFVFFMDVGIFWGLVIIIWMLNL